MNGSENRNSLEIATLGGGCFWCLEAIFAALRGVEKVESGFSGGTRVNPSYEQVCTGATGHAEVVQITYNPSQIPYRALLNVFFTVHNPTTLNRQGDDVGTQYRSVIFYHTEEQADIARTVIAEVNEAKVWDAPLVTQVEPFNTFYPAEEYHRDYFNRNPQQPYCRVVVAPKVAKFRQKFVDALRK